jgi:hypothetical protein
MCPPYLPPLHWGTAHRCPSPAAPAPGLAASSARHALRNAAFIFVPPALFPLISCCASLRRQIARRLLLASKHHLLVPPRLAHQCCIHLADRSGAAVAPPPPGEALPHDARLHAIRRDCQKLHLPAAAHARPASGLAGERAGACLVAGAGAGGCGLADEACPICRGPAHAMAELRRKLAKLVSAARMGSAARPRAPVVLPSVFELHHLSSYQPPGPASPKQAPAKTRLHWWHVPRIEAG